MTDSYKRRELTQQDTEFLRNLQNRMNTQDSCGQADPRFWVIMGSKKRYGIDDGYESGFDIIDDNASEIIADNVEQAYEYIRDEVVPELNEENDEKFSICKVNSDTFAIIRNGDTDFEGDFNDIVDYLKIFGYHFSMKNYIMEEYIYPDTMFMTLDSAKDHLKRNYYHYSKDAHPYAMTALRNTEVEMLWDILHHVDFDSLEMKTRYRLVSRIDSNMMAGPWDIEEIISFLKKLKESEELYDENKSYRVRRTDKGIRSDKIHEGNWQIWCSYFDYDAKLASPLKDKPWYIEKWFDQDIIDVMNELEIPVTDKSLAKAKKAVTGIFDEKTDRNELLKQWIENEFTFDEVELCPYCNMETNMSKMIQKCEHCGRLIICCSMCDDRSQCGQCQYEEQIKELEKGE